MQIIKDCLILVLQDIELEHQTTLFPVGHLYLSSMECDCITDNGQTKSRTAVIPCPAFRYTIEVIVQ